MSSSPPNVPEIESEGDISRSRWNFADGAFSFIACSKLRMVFVLSNSSGARWNRVGRRSAI